MKKYILICALTSLSILTKAQEADTVAKKIADLPYTKCEIPPQFKGDNIQSYVPKNFKIPKTLPNNFKGEIVVALFIDSEGKLIEIKLLKGESLDLNQEVLRVFDKTKWISAINNFKKVNYNLVLRLSIINGPDKKNSEVSVLPNYASTPFIQIDPSDAGNNIYTQVEIKPDFPGGRDEFYSYLARTVVYPQKAKRNNIQGMVFTSFVIEKDGSLSNIIVLRSPDEELSLETLRVLKNCPKFSPGIQNGKPVRVFYGMPLMFTLAKR